MTEVANGVNKIYIGSLAKDGEIASEFEFADIDNNGYIERDEFIDTYQFLNPEMDVEIANYMFDAGIDKIMNREIYQLLNPKMSSRMEKYAKRGLNPAHEAIVREALKDPIASIRLYASNILMPYLPNTEFQNILGVAKMFY